MNWFDFIYKCSLIGTFGVLIKYTHETYLIRKLTTEQKDLQLLPAMMLYINAPDGDDEKNHKLMIKNVGHGSAVAIKIKPTVFEIDGKRLEFKFKLSQLNNTLMAGEEREVEIEVHRDDESMYHDRYQYFYAYFNPENLESVGWFKKAKMVKEDTPEESDIDIRFSDLKGQEYETTIGFRGDTVSLVKIPERLKK